MAASLAVCLIARNEAANMPRALASVRDVADEIIVTDTGSTDDTRKIAAGFGAKVFEFPWCDDFSAARNVSLSHASTDWVLWLDADEELRSETVPVLRNAVENPRGLAHMILRRDFFAPNDFDRYSLSWQMRLFRRRADLRFIGRCHPHFAVRLDTLARQEGLIYSPIDVELNHYGYVEPRLRRAKMERAARLLELELKDRPGQVYYLVELGRTLMGFDVERGKAVMSEAAAALAAACDQPQAPEPSYAMILEHLLQTPAQLPAQLSHELVRELCERWFPKAPPLIWLRAREDYDAGRFAACEKRLRRLLELGRDHTYDRWIGFSPGIVGDEAELCLGACLIRLARLRDAEALFRDLLRRGKCVEAARANLAAIESIRRGQ